jgi:hypothetical protein
MTVDTKICTWGKIATTTSIGSYACVEKPKTDINITLDFYTEAISPTSHCR